MNGYCMSLKLDVRSFHASDMLIGMAKNPKTRRPADVVGNAVRVMQIATGESEEDDPAALERAERREANPAPGSFLQKGA